MTASRNKPYIVTAGSAVLVLVISWALWHIKNIVQNRYGHGSELTLLYALSFVSLLWQTIAYNFERPHEADGRQMYALRQKRVIVNVPVCNEDEQALRECLLSLALQTRPVDIVQVVVNGPNSVNYVGVQAYAKVLIARYKMQISWVTQEIAGKRHAQATTARDFLRPGDLFLTVDSDALLDPHAVEELIKPFADPQVMSAAGVVLTANNRASMLTRLSDLLFQTWQLTDRSAASTFGSVLVNSGVLAMYRAHVLLDNLDGYLAETFFGRPVQFSDDSMLTLYALQHGKTVQQPTSFVFTLMPENFSHHFRQQVRWARGSFIRSWWRFKYLPITGYAYWSHLFRWLQVLLSAVTFGYMFIWSPIITRQMLPYLVVIPLAIGYMQSLRYFAISRSDESTLYRIGTWLLQPIPGLWSFFVLRAVRYYGIATCLKTGWGTRQTVEVSLTN